MGRRYTLLVALLGVVLVGSAAIYAARITIEWDASDEAWRQQKIAEVETAEAAEAARIAAEEAALKAAEEARLAALQEVEARAAASDYHRARWDPLHFKPAIDEATDEQCLVCHMDILERRPLNTSPAGVEAVSTLAWYQTLDTYEGEQDTFHRRHAESDFAKQVMDLKCTFCHQGNDPREESPDLVADGRLSDGAPAFTLRKMINPSDTCLRCHGSFPWEIMEGLVGPWHEGRADFEDEETLNGCLVCHQDLYRTVRHQVSYLNAEAIEEAAATSSDVCYGCHGGRAWFMNSYPYPRHPWPDMPEEVPEWAADRPTESDPRYRLPMEQAQRTDG